jgi:hypothetical protein
VAASTGEVVVGVETSRTLLKLLNVKELVVVVRVLDVFFTATKNQRDSVKQNFEKSIGRLKLLLLQPTIL